MDEATDNAAPGRPRLALSIPNMAEPAELVELGVRAAASGWDGVFLWDHAHGSVDMPVPTADPLVLLGALAVRTEHVVLGTAITALARRRPHKLARDRKSTRLHTSQYCASRMPSSDIKQPKHTLC